MADLLVPSRRSFLTGLISLVAAPAIVRVESLMPIRATRQLTIEEFINLVIQPMRLEEWQREVITHLNNAMIYGHSTMLITPTKVSTSIFPEAPHG